MRKTQQKGITLLLSVIISSVAALLGLGVFMVIFGEIGISGTSKPSVIAFYAADTGLECSLYADIILNKFATTSPQATNIDCNGTAVPMTYTPDGIGGGTFKFNFQVSSQACATVNAAKLNTGQTVIDSYGENRPNCAAASSARVYQRGLQVLY